MATVAVKKALAPPVVIGDTSNDGKSVIESGEPYVARVSVEGTSVILFHRWSVDGVEAKSKAAKGSKAKKEDDLESYVWRDADGVLSIPAEYFYMSTVNAAKYKQDPRSPRKSAMDLFKAGIIPLDDLCPLGKKNWEYVDRRRVRVQQQGITRARPGMFAGWKVTMRFQVLLPEYISHSLLNETIAAAGRLCGVGDRRPTFGRFQITNFTVEQ